ncbi:MAG: O-acetylhomoserine aminocarboxypropyltransferase/cysteine synthase family protein [Christensenellales bacterium]|jgi:O-acetylhomoserine (thiol)-lyase|nr:O-acetylhomoserine aminocarboxypropyltransferase/cysteine synthase [Clostridiales bacterium]
MKSIDTKCVQAGYNPQNGEARVFPIYQSTTFSYETPEEMGDLFDLKKSGFFYTRLSNPTLDALEQKITALDGGVGAMACSSGMAAIYLTTLTLASKGDNILSISSIYGGTYNLFNVTLPKIGIECRFFKPDSGIEDIEKLIDDRTKFIFVETLANPAMKIADFDMLKAISDKYGIVIVVDNSLATPVICRPLEWGAHIVVYSATKYLDGHARSLGGLIVDGGNFNYCGNNRYADFNTPDDSYHGMVYAKQCGKAAFITKARVQYMRDIGAQMAPMNAFLINMGMETLHLRMPRHSDNALAVAKLLQNNPAVEWVKYAGLESDENYPQARKYFDNLWCSGMVTFGIKGGREAASKFQKALKLFRIVTHIADARSCVLHPASSTHRQLSDQDLIDCGISDNLIRLSVGIESKEDILQDIDEALLISQRS